jgi:hypothetical protein
MTQPPESATRSVADRREVVSGIARKCVKRLSKLLISLSRGVSVGTGPLSRLGFSVHLIDLMDQEKLNNFSQINSSEDLEAVPLDHYENDNKEVALLLRVQF